MATMKMPMAVGTGGGIDSSYKIIGVAASDSTSTSITVPANTDFVIVDTMATYTNTSLDLSSNDVTVGVLKNVGDTVQIDGSYASGYISNSQTFVWTNATTITQTRANNRGYVNYIFCKNN